eukprot:COSAG01_NODE_72873_length_251_cov_5.256579_1_plen_83_part_11
MQHVAYVGSFARWAEFCEEKRRLRRVTSRLTNVRASRALSAWMDAVDMWQSEREESEHQSRLESLRADLEAQRERAIVQIVSR